MRLLLVFIIILVVAACKKNETPIAPITIKMGNFEGLINDTLSKYEAFGINTQLTGVNKQIIYALGTKGEELKITFTLFIPEKGKKYETKFQKQPAGANVQIIYYKADSTKYYCHGDTGKCLIEVLDVTEFNIQLRLWVNAVNVNNPKDIIKLKDVQINASIENGVPMGIAQIAVNGKIIEFNAWGKITSKTTQFAGKSFNNYEKISFNLLQLATIKQYIFSDPKEIATPIFIYSPKGETKTYLAGEESIDGKGRGNISFTKVDDLKMMGTINCWAYFNVTDSVEITQGKFFIKFKK